ncbi:MAG: hypothetical protein GY839_09510 [candidate division Zixibacteria bacterium]|nr:hypothetical protein [candidate division Zixibacteria bacterium]
MKSAWLAILVILLAAGVTAADFTDYSDIAVSSPLITQIYNNPELSDLEDVDLSSESQIKLYENFGADICLALSNRYKDKIDFLCYGDIQERLNNAESWNLFNRNFTGSNHVPSEISAGLVDKLGVVGVVNSYLMFSYYENSNQAQHMEVHFEWYLIDMASGESVLSDEYKCQNDFRIKSDDSAGEFDCFAGIIEYLENYGGNK